MKKRNHTCNHLMYSENIIMSLKQGFSQDKKSGHPNCTIGPTQLNSLRGNI